MSELLPATLSAARALFGFRRGDVMEVVVNGFVWSASDLSPYTGPDLPLIARSLLKPWQFLASQSAIGGASRHWSKRAHWSIGLASHAGQPHHMQALRGLADELGVDSGELCCPAAMPMDDMAAARIKVAGESPTKFHHPCAGKHLMFAAANRGLGGKDGYLMRPTPVHDRLWARLGADTGIDAASFRAQTLSDSCGLPTVVMPVSAHLALWQALGAGSSETDTALKSLWLANPETTGGYGRLDTELMQALPGRILAKEGADGLLVVQSLPNAGEGPATALVKIASGYNAKYLGLALWAHLAKQSALTPSFKALLEVLAERRAGWVPSDQQLELF